MPTPQHKGRQEKGDFVSSCMSDEVMNHEFPQANQRSAVCHSKYREAKSKSEGCACWEETLEEIESQPYIIY